ncbi:EMB2654 [Symbiodinium natans]|uniref:EMB2654 protein n=1 Tax=Symbiodinium natans TaxID=878477 RepID=A0A812Q1L1_9DINO|nr:EMB2654 [Symbiodinium natans]
MGRIMAQKSVQEQGKLLQLWLDPSTCSLVLPCKDLDVPLVWTRAARETSGREVRPHEAAKHHRGGGEDTKKVQIVARADSSEPPGMPPMMRSRVRRASLASNMSKLSASSFFTQENQAVGRLGQFLRNPESSQAAWVFASLWNYFIAVTVFLSLGQTSVNPLLSGVAIGIADAVVEFIFLLECIAEIAVEPCELSVRLDFSKNMYTLIDVLAVVPLPIRIATGFELPAAAEFAFAHYLLVCVVPMLRLLKLIRRFGQIQLLAHVFRTTGDALKFLLFLVSIIVLLFSTLLYIFEPSSNVDSMFTAMWVSTVTVTTVGFGDITPVTSEGKMLMGVLCFFSSLFMAMPISVLGNAMSHAWTDRNRILLMARMTLQASDNALHAISTDGLRCNLIPMNAGISVCERSGRWHLAAQLHQYLRDQLLESDVITGNTAISACEKANLWKPGLSLLASMQQQGVETDSITFNGAMAACEKGEQWEEALQLFKDLCVGRGPSVVSYGSAVSACGRGGDWRRGFSMLSELGKSRLEATTAVFGAAITQCEHDAQWPATLALLGELLHHQLEVNIAIYGAAISVMERSWKWQWAVALLTDMELARVQANVIPYNAAISALSHASRWQLAVDYLAVVTESSVEINVVTLAAVATACGRAGIWQQALGLLHVAQEKSLSNIVSYGAAISACEQNEEWQQALGLLSSALAENLQANAVIFSAAMSACAKASMWRQALALYLRARHAGVERDTVLASSAISAAGEGKSWLGAAQLLTEMYVAEQAPNLVACNSAMAVFRDAGTWRKVLHLFQDMERGGMEVDAVACGVALDACEKASESQQASALLTSLDSDQLCRLQEFWETRRFSGDSDG